jgi:hypothetical protein
VLIRLRSIIEEDLEAEARASSEGSVTLRYPSASDHNEGRDQ